jgi:hypothetical protein
MPPCRPFRDAKREFGVKSAREGFGRDAKYYWRLGEPFQTAIVVSREDLVAGLARDAEQHLAKKILTTKAALEGERKQVTVLFADLKGSMS